MYKRQPRSDSSYTDTWSGNETVTIRTNFDDTHTWISRGCHIEYVDPPSLNTTTDVPNYSVKIVAHESFEAQNANTCVSHTGTTTGLPVGSPHTDSGVTLSSFSSGQSTLLNLIDLRYSQSTPSTEVLIEYDQQDASESIQDWRNILGSYTPHENTVAVSFEIIADLDPPGDNDGYDQTVVLDSATLAIASVNTDLALSLIHI